MSTLYQMCGLSGAGKSTWAKRLGAVTVLSADEIRTLGIKPRAAFARLHAAIPVALAAGDVVIDTRALVAFERARVLRIGRRAGARCVLVIVDTPWRVCRERNAARTQPAPVQWIDALAALERTRRAAVREGWDDVSFVKGDS